MKMELCFEVDTPTQNGRIYQKENMQSAIERYLQIAEERRFINLSDNPFSRDISEIIGNVKDVTINDDNTITVDFDINMNLPNSMIFMAVMQNDPSYLEITPIFTAEVTEDKVVDVKNIEGFVAVYKG